MRRGVFCVGTFRLGGAPTPGVEPTLEVGTPASGADGPIRCGKVILRGRNASITEDAEQRVHGSGSPSRIVARIPWGHRREKQESPMRPQQVRASG